MKEDILGVLKVLAAGIVLGFVLLVLIPQPAHAKPVAAAQGEGVSVVLTDEPCALSAVTNLPYAATWTEKGKTIKGCWGAHPQFPIVIAYWADKTVSVVHVSALHDVTEI